MFRKRNPTLLDRLPTDEISDSAAALRHRAQDAVDAVAPRVEAARDALAPRVEAARDALAPHVEAARDAIAPRTKAAGKAARKAVGPRVESVRDALAPRMETMWGSIAPTVGTVAASAIEAARQRAEETAKSTAPTRKEARRRGKLAAAALRGERPPRRWPSIFSALGLGVILGAVAGVLARRMTSPAPPSYDFTSPAATPAPTPRARHSTTPPIRRNEENVADLSTSSDGTATTADSPGGDTAVESTAHDGPPGDGQSRSATKPAPSPPPPAAKKAPPAEE